MSDQKIAPVRVSEKPENYGSVFDQALDAARSVRHGGLEPREGDTIAKNLAVAQKVLDGDLKARGFEYRLNARDVTRRQLQSPKAAS